MDVLDKRYSSIYLNVKGLFKLGKENEFKDELEIVGGEWEFLTGELELPPGDMVVAVLLEELLIHRVLGIRLMHQVGQHGVVLETATASGRTSRAGHPGVDLLAKNQERYRKTMKELLERLGQGESGTGENLGELMVPILEKGEGVLEDAMEFEARKKSVKKAGDESGGSTGVAESA